MIPIGKSATASTDHPHHNDGNAPDVELGPTSSPPHHPSASQDIVVPPHLLETVSPHLEWTPDTGRNRRESALGVQPDRGFDVVQLAREHRNDFLSVHQRPNSRGRAVSITLGALSRSRDTGYDSRRANDVTILGSRVPLRKTSLPAIFESSGSDNRSDRSSSYQPGLSDKGSWEFLPPLKINDAATLPVDNTLHNTTLFKKLSHYDLSKRSHEAPPLTRTSSDSVDPHHSVTSIGLGSEKDAEDAPTEFLEVRPASSMSRSRNPSVIQQAVDTITSVVQNATHAVRRTSLYDVYETAKKRGVELQRKKWVQLLFECTIYLLIICFVYFVLVGRPLWKGAVWWLYWVVANKFVVAGTWSITIGLSIFYAYAPLLILFEKEPPMPAPEDIDATRTPGVHNTALLIPCYKSANIIGPTLEAAIKIFPPSHIFVLANGNSPTPLDNTEEVIRPFGVHHIWSPVGSKIVAQFVGCYAARQFTNVLLIDDDCALPPNFPIVSDRMKGKVQCIGYTIKSVGPNSSKGTLCQQAQDLEYKISGLQRTLAGKIGSATFPHGAISLWDTEFLIKTFHTHPGFSVSEDWFFGHVARQLGSRIQMCTAVFVETETPTSVFFSSGGSRGGFGEMTIFKQRFYRWNFFFVNGMYYNMKYIFTSWRLGFWEFGAKLFVFQEVYETLLYLLAPFVLPVSLIVRPAFCGYLIAGTFGMYYANAIIFNELHLRLRNERVGFVAIYLYYMPFKIVLTVVNVFSCYYSLYKYARYFAKRHPKVIEDERAVEVVLKLEEQKAAKGAQPDQGRRMTVTAVGSRLSHEAGRLSTTTVQNSAAVLTHMASTSARTGRQQNPPVPTTPERTEAVDFAQVAIES